MFNDDTDAEWEKFGKQDPYFGVLTEEKYRSVNLSSKAREEFFQSGVAHINHTLHQVRQFLGDSFTPGRAIDFGCGVGRLAIPLAEHAEEVTAIDVSDAMLREADNNAKELGVSNMVLAKSDDSLSCLHGNYDFIHSYIVFQHMHVDRGEQIFACLLSHLNLGGVGVMHFTYGSTSRTKKLSSLVTKVPFAHKLMNVIRGREFSAPKMEMNEYDINRLNVILKTAGASVFHSEFTDHGGELGVVLYFQKI